MKVHIIYTDHMKLQKLYWQYNPGFRKIVPGTSQEFYQSQPFNVELLFNLGLLYKLVVIDS